MRNMVSQSKAAYEHEAQQLQAVTSSCTTPISPRRVFCTNVIQVKRCCDVFAERRARGRGLAFGL